MNISKRENYSILFLMTALLMMTFGVATFAEESDIPEEKKKSVSPFLNIKTVKKEEITTLPMNKDEVSKIVDNMTIQMPQEGDYTGVFTRETIVYEKRGTLSLQYLYESTIKTADGKPYVGTIKSPVKLLRSDLPQPGISNTSFITGIFVETEEPVVIDPPAKIRIPLKEQQYGNQEFTAYYFNSESEKYENAKAYLTEDGKGFHIPMAHNGYYAIFTSAGELPDYEKIEEKESQESEKAQQEEEKNKETDSPIPKKKEIKSVLTNEYLDISEHWAKIFIQKLSNMGIATGKTTQLYSPDEAATRAEIIKMIVDREFDDEEINTCLRTYMPSEYSMVFFTDVQQNHKYAKYICMAAIHKITRGLNDGTFAPDRPLSRAEALKLLYEAVGEDISFGNTLSSPFADVSDSDWFAAPILQAVKKGVATGFTEYIGEKPYIEGEHLNKGEQTKNGEILQQILFELRFYTGERDGLLDEDVINAILQYQLARGIISTPTDISAGVVGPATIAALNAEGGATITPENIKNVFRPHQSITRAELAKFAVLIFGLIEEKETKDNNLVPK